MQCTNFYSESKNDIVSQSENRNAKNLLSFSNRLHLLSQYDKCPIKYQFKEGQTECVLLIKKNSYKHQQCIELT